MAAKKLINEPNECVRESLIGFVRSHKNVQLLGDENIIIRRDARSFVENGHVAVISGGGSGHEPAHIGYVGSGMLTAVICGSVFASPSVSSILAALRACQSSNGILVIVKNYTGDRINFGKAIEYARSEGINASMVIVGEDVALAGKANNAGRRGLCGAILIHKIAGSMSESGKSLDEITKMVNAYKDSMATISVSLSPCSLPGQIPTFQIDDNSAEFGLGIHGEAGVATIKMESAKKMIMKMLQHAIDTNIIPLDCTGPPIVLIVNNLCATTNIELSIVASEALQFLEKKGHNVVRCYVGQFMTALNMAGVSLTISVSNEDALRCLDSATDAPAWPKDNACVVVNPTDIIFNQKKSVKKTSTENVIQELSDDGRQSYNCVDAIVDILLASEDELNELDRKAGDGDCGSTLAKGAIAIRSAMGSRDQPRLPFNSIGDLLYSLSQIVEESTGGTSGALIGILLLRMSTALKNNTEFPIAFEYGLDTVMTYGGARQGQRTMIDALMPSLNALKSTWNDQSMTCAGRTKTMAEAARKGALSTTAMLSSAGRSSYVSADKLTHPDPGASVVALVMEAIASSLSAGL